MYSGLTSEQSRRVTYFYADYRKSLGQTDKSFKKAIAHETDYLVMIDDVLDEIAMIRRVHQDQDHVIRCLKGNWGHALPADHETDTAPGRSNESLRSPESRYVTERLERIEEDARRVRESVSCCFFPPRLQYPPPFLDGETIAKATSDVCTYLDNHSS